MPLPIGAAAVTITLLGMALGQINTGPDQHRARSIPGQVPGRINTGFGAFGVRLAAAVLMRRPEGPGAAGAGHQ